MRKFVLAVGLVLMASSAQATTLNVVGGQLHGASGVNVGGALFNVEFRLGRCADLYNGCDEVSDFTFQSQADALLASQALLDQVFLDISPAQLFDTEPHRTFPCLPSPYDHISDYCAISTPHGFEGVTLEPGVGVAFAGNYIFEGPGSLFSSGDDTGYGQRSTSTYSLDPPCTLPVNRCGWAVWTAAPPAIPEPNTALLLGLGLVGLATRKKTWGRSNSPLVALALPLLLFVPNESKAALIANDLATPGDGLITLDSQTGLQWLDLELTIGLSHNDVTGGLGNSWYADGWRHANASEVCELFDSQIGLPTDTCPTPESFDVDESVVEAFFELMTPAAPDDWPILSGAYGEFDLAVGPGVGQATMGINPIYGGYAGVERDHFGLSADARSQRIGNWLVRPIPEPNTALLLSLGLTGLSWKGRRSLRS